MFIRTSCAHIARPDTWKIESGPLGMAYSPLSARVIWLMRPFRNDERRLILDGVLGEGGLLGRQVDGVAVEAGLQRHAVHRRAGDRAVDARRPARERSAFWKSMSRALNPGVEALAMFEARIPMR